jgi:hypothetical protein
MALPDLRKSLAWPLANSRSIVLIKPRESC